MTTTRPQPRRGLGSRRVARVPIRPPTAARQPQGPRQAQAQEQENVLAPPAVLAPAPVARSGGRRAGALTYSQNEVMNLLEIMETILPIGNDEWERVNSLHANRYPGRTCDSIKRKFASLHRRRAPTGDPNIPEDVRRAKRIKYRIANKAELGDAEEVFDLVQGHGDDGPPDPNDEAPRDPPLGGDVPIEDQAVANDVAIAEAVANDVAIAEAVASYAEDESVSGTRSKRSYNKKTDLHKQAFDSLERILENVGKRQVEQQQQFFAAAMATMESIASRFAPSGG